MILPYDAYLHLAIDIGNTRTKIAGFWEKKTMLNGESPPSFWIVETQILEKELTKIVEMMPQDLAFSVGWISTSRIQPIADFECWQHFNALPRFLPIDASFPFPVQNDYATPLTLGTDRIVAIIAAQKPNPNLPILVIDAGTAITYDFSDEKGHYKGGGISPGIRMKFRALHEFTARLPLIEEKEYVDLIGNSTKSNLMSGVINGTIAEIQGVIYQYQQECPQIKVYLTGGDADFLFPKLQCVDMKDNFLVLKGIDILMKKE